MSPSLRSSAALVLVSVVATAVALRFTWQPEIASLYDDSVSYLVMAQAFSPFQSASPAVLAAFRHETYPPLFPVLIALTGGAFDWRVAHALIALSFGASVFLFGLCARDITRSAAIAAASALVYAMLPGAWLNVKGILSEFPYMALSFLALAIHQRQGGAAPSRRTAIALAAVLAAVVLTRTIGVTLAIAFALAEILRYRRDRRVERLRAAAWMLVIPAGAAAAWYALRPTASPDTYASSALGVLGNLRDQGPAWLGALIVENAGSLSDAWLTAWVIFWGEPWQPRFLLASAFGIAGIAAMAYRAARAEADALYGALFLAILLGWPYAGQMYRLALPVVPLVMLNAAWLVALALRRGYAEPRATWAAGAAALAPLVLCAPAVLFYVAERARLDEWRSGAYRQVDIAEFYRVPVRRDAEASARAQIAVLDDMDRIRVSTPENARVMWYVPSYIALLAQREGVPLDYPGTRAALADQVRRADPDFIYLANLHPRDSHGRLGNPLAPAALARDYTQLVWLRQGERPGEAHAVLLKVDRARLASSS